MAAWGVGVTSGATGMVHVSTMRRIVVATAWLATVVGAVALVVLGFVGPFDFSEGGFRLVFVGLGFDVLVFATVGSVLSVRRPSNAVGLILTLSGLLVSLTFLAFIFGALLTATRGQDDVLAGVVSLVGSLGIDPTLIVTGALLALVFPDGRLPGPRWRWAVLAIGAAVIFASGLVLVHPGPIGESLAINPFGISGIPWLESVSSAGVSLDAIALVAALFLALLAVVVRYRRSRGAEREQLKWFVGANLLVVFFLSLSLADGATRPTAFDMLAVVSLSLPPIAVGIAILRYRLYEIDRLISRTIGWAVITFSLVTVFAASVIGLQAVLAGFTQDETIAVAASTLVAFALFQPLRQRVQVAIDRRFDRGRYDGQQVVDAFARRLRDEVDLDRLRIDLLTTADGVVRPVSASIWLRSPEAAR
jgi:hypothetical protein